MSVVRSINFNQFHHHHQIGDDRLVNRHQYAYSRRQLANDLRDVDAAD